MSYDTNTPYSSFFLTQMGQAALLSIFSALMVVSSPSCRGSRCIASCSPIKSCPLNVGLRLPGIRTKGIFSCER